MPSERQLGAGALVYVQLLLSRCDVQNQVFSLCCQKRDDITFLLPGMLPYRVRSSCRRMSKTSACCGRQPTSTWPRIPATASLFMNFCSACSRCFIFCIHPAVLFTYKGSAYDSGTQPQHTGSVVHTTSQYPMRSWNSPSVYLYIQEPAVLLPALLSLQSHVWLHASQPGPSPFLLLQ